MRSFIIIETITLSPSLVSRESTAKISPQTVTFPLCISTSMSFIGRCLTGLPITRVISETSIGSPSESKPPATFAAGRGCGCAFGFGSTDFGANEVFTVGAGSLILSTSVTPVKTTSISFPNSSRTIFLSTASQRSFVSISAPPWASSIVRVSPSKSALLSTKKPFTYAPLAPASATRSP